MKSFADLTYFESSFRIARLHIIAVSVFSFVVFIRVLNSPSSLKIFGPSDKRDQLEPALIWATPGQRGFPSRNDKTKSSAVATSSRRGASTAPTASSSSREPWKQTPGQTEAAQKQQESLQKAVELRQMLSNLEKVDDESRRSSLLDTLCSTDDVLNLPVHPNPPGLKNGDLTVDLLKHQVSMLSSICFMFLMPFSQSQGLQWCVEREYPVLPKKETDRPVQFWQLRKNGSKVSNRIPSCLYFANCFFDSLIITTVGLRLVSRMFSLIRHQLLPKHPRKLNPYLVEAPYVQMLWYFYFLCLNHTG